MKPVLSTSSRVLVTGITSIHGWPIFARLRSMLGEPAVVGIRPPKLRLPDGPGIEALCITDTIGLERIRQQFHPTHVVHCAGVCDLDVCEERPRWAHSLNTLGARAVVEVFGRHCRILYTSADLVFSGDNAPPQGYTESDLPDPVSVAGKTIAAAEREIARAPDHCILRLGLPIGESVGGHAGAVDFVASRLRRQLPVTLFYDEWRSCLSCDTLARAAVSLLESSAQGLYHCGGPVGVSLYDLGKWIVRTGNYPSQLLSTMSRHDEVDGPPRIGNVSLDSSRLIHFLRQRDMSLVRQISAPVIV